MTYDQQKHLGDTRFRSRAEFALGRLQGHPNLATERATEDASGGASEGKRPSDKRSGGDDRFPRRVDQGERGAKGRVEAPKNEALGKESCEPKTPPQPRLAAELKRVFFENANPYSVLKIKHWRIEK